MEVNEVDDDLALLDDYEDADSLIPSASVAESRGNTPIPDGVASPNTLTPDDVASPRLALPSSNTLPISAPSSHATSQVTALIPVVVSHPSSSPSDRLPAPTPNLRVTKATSTAPEPIARSPPSVHLPAPAEQIPPSPTAVILDPGSTLAPSHTTEPDKPEDGPVTLALDKWMPRTTRVGPLPPKSTPSCKNHTGSSLWPEWMTEAVDALEPMLDNQIWADVMWNWVSLEELLGFPQGQVSNIVFYGVFALLITTL